MENLCFGTNSKNFTMPTMPRRTKNNARIVPPIPILAVVSNKFSCGMLSKKITEISGVSAKKKTAISNFFNQT